MLPIVIELLASAFQFSRHLDGCQRIDDTLVDDRRCRNHLSRRAWLEDVGDGSVPTIIVGRLCEMVGVEVGSRHHREDLTSANIHHNRGGAQGAGSLYDSLKSFLGDELNVAIDGQLDVRSSDRRGGRLILCRNHAAAWTALVRLLSRGAGEDVVEGRFDAGSTRSVSLHEAHDVRGQVACRVRALRGFFTEDAR